MRKVLYQLPSECRTISINETMIEPTNVVRDLGVWIDANLTMRSHVSRVAQTCFRLRCLRRQLGQDVTARLITSLVLPRLDYCNPVLVGLAATTLASLQRVLHTASDMRRSTLQTRLHRLPIFQRDGRCGPLTAATSSSHEQTPRAATERSLSGKQLPLSKRSVNRTETPAVDNNFQATFWRPFLFQRAFSLETPF